MLTPSSSSSGEEPAELHTEPQVRSPQQQEDEGEQQRRFLTFHLIELIELIYLIARIDCIYLIELIECIEPARFFGGEVTSVVLFQDLRRLQDLQRLRGWTRTR